METRAARLSLGLWTLLVILFLWMPLVLICVYAFNSSNIQSWPIAGFSTKWFQTAWHNEEARTALVLSLKAAGFATAIALALGTAAATAVSRFRFFGRDAITFLLVLPGRVEPRRAEPGDGPALDVRGIEGVDADQD